MAQLTKTSSAPNYSVTTMQSILTSLIAAMAAGQQINAADIAQLKAATYDTFRAHNHTVTDTIGIDGAGAPYVYGVAPGQTTTETSSAAYQGSSGTTGYTTTATPSGIAANNTINASDINTIITLINQMYTHYHTVTDQVGTAGVPAPNLGSSSIIVSSTGNLGTGGTLSSALIFNSNGQLQTRTQDQTYGYYYSTISNEWATYNPFSPTTAAGFEVFVTIVSIDSTSGSSASYTGSIPLNTWTNLGSGGTVVNDASGTWVAGGVNTDGYANMNLSVSVRQVGVPASTVTQSVALRCDFPPPFEGGCCFPAGANVLMADGSWKLIEDIVAGDLVMGMGVPEVITEVTRPVLGNRKMITFGDGSLSWSEEHAFWTKDSTDSQWWWSANAVQWRLEAQHGVMGGLFDNDSIRSARNVAAWAHVDGWKTNTIQVAPGTPDEQLYLPRTSGSPIIVNGYVVGAGVNQSGYDYTKLDWNAVLPTLPTVQPLQ